VSNESFPGSFGAEMGGRTVDLCRQLVQTVHRDDDHPFVQHVDAGAVADVERLEIHRLEALRHDVGVRISKEPQCRVPVPRFDPSNTWPGLSRKRDQLLHDGLTGPHGDEQPLHWDQHAPQNYTPVMAFPPDLLSDDEEVVADMHPHWWTITPISALLAGLVLLGIVLLAIDRDGGLWVALQVIVGLAVLVTLVKFAMEYAKWVTTEFVVTTERVISRSGVLSKEGIEIPLDRINTVFFNQSVFERLAGAGDLGIESAGEGGRQTFNNIRRPNHVQAEIYAQKEAFEERRYEKMRGAASSPTETSIPEQIAQLDELRQRGAITQLEFDEKKAEMLRRM